MNSARFLMTVGIVSILVPGLARAEQGTAPAKPVAATTEVPKVDVQMKDFAFSAARPEGWRADPEGPKKYRVNLVLVPEAPGSDAVILVSADHKFDENIALRLQTQIEAYRGRYPRLETGELDVKHPVYATFPKQMSQAGDLYQSMAYVNPGTLYQYVFYISLTTKKAPPTPAEMAAFREVLESLRANTVKEKGG